MHRKGIIKKKMNSSCLFSILVCQLNINKKHQTKLNNKTQKHAATTVQNATSIVHEMTKIIDDNDFKTSSKI